MRLLSSQLLHEDFTSLTPKRKHPPVLNGDIPDPVPLPARVADLQGCKAHCTAEGKHGQE